MDYVKSNNTYFATPKDDWKDRIELEIGDSKEPNVILPQQKISRWDNECNVSIRLKDFNEYSVYQDNDKVIFGNEKQEVHIYPITDGEGGQEFEVILHGKPISNVIEFTLQDKDVEYFYQPALTAEEILKGAIRPENVVGSYAIYASENKINYVGGKEYKCGKVGHIFRPKIIDSVGMETCGDLHIENGILSVTIPQEFLDKAVYPIRHAAGLTFGYDSQGDTVHGALSAGLGNYIWHNNTYTGAVGTGTSMSFYAVGNGTYKGSLALYNNTVLVGNVGEMTPSSANWYSSNFISNPTTSAIPYKLAWWTNNSALAVYYDDSSPVESEIKSATYSTTWPNPITWGGTTGHKKIWSIYCTYTAGGGAAAPTPKRTLLGVGT